MHGTLISVLLQSHQHMKYVNTEQTTSVSDTYINASPVLMKMSLNLMIPQVSLSKVER